MKKNILKNIISKKGLILLLLAFFAMPSCDDDINKAKDMPDPSVLDRDYRWGSFLTTMQRYVVPEESNLFQRAFNLTGDVYSGYFGATNIWFGGANGTTYAFQPDWYNEPVKVLFSNILPAWKKIDMNMDKKSLIHAVAQIVKITAAQRTTDMHGPMPYSQFGIIINNTPYDSQEEIYNLFFEEINIAIKALEDYVANNDPSSRPLAKFDIVYDSDITKWIKYANSLKLRMAMRIRYADPVNAKKYALQALDPAGYGVITDNSDNAMVSRNNKLGIMVANPLKMMWQDYDDIRMGANMESFLLGYKDPRIEKYFQQSAYPSTTYKGVRSGISIKDRQKYLLYSKPNIYVESPMIWMTAAEVYFLRAEVALLKWTTTESVESLYTEGIRTSFKQWGIASYDAYIENTTNKPISYVDPVSSANNVGAGKYLSTITVGWVENGVNDETKLERIITQKWIAMYPNGAEAWAEFRRTGYPKVFPVALNLSNGKVSTDKQVRRIPFSADEWAGNREQVEKAVILLGGPDTGGTPLWWDKKN